MEKPNFFISLDILNTLLHMDYDINAQPSWI